MTGKKKAVQQTVAVVFLLAAIIIVFQWYAIENTNRMEERNKNYAADSARLTAARINEELNNAQGLINTYAYLLGKNTEEHSISAQTLGEMEEGTMFDALLFTDAAGIDYASDGRTADVTKREFYVKGIAGESGISIVFDPHFFKETMACFYAPFYIEGEMAGVLRGGISGGRISEKYAFNHIFW